MSEVSEAVEPEVSETAVEPAVEPVAEPGEPNWRDSVTDVELRKVADRFNSPADAVKSVADLRKQLSQAIKLPAKDAKPEEVAAFRKALGVPETAEGYEVFKSAEGEELDPATIEFRGTMSKAMHEAGIPASAAAKLVETYKAYEEQFRAAQVAADKQYVEATQAALRKEWGADYDRNSALASRAAQQLLGQDFAVFQQVETKDGRLLLDNPVMVKLFAKVGGEMDEGTVGPRLDKNETASIQQRIAELGDQKMVAYNAGDRATATRLDREQRALFEKLGNQPLVGTMGRTV